MDFTPLLLVGSFGILVLSVLSIVGLILAIRKGVINIDDLKGGLGGDHGGYKIIDGIPTEDCRARAKNECDSKLPSTKYKECEERVRLECISEGGSWTYRDPNSVGTDGRTKLPWETKTETKYGNMQKPVYVDACTVDTGNFMQGWGHHKCSGKYCDSSTGLCTKLLDGTIPAIENVPNDASCDDLRIVYARWNDTPRYWENVATDRGCPK